MGRDILARVVKVAVVIVALTVTATVVLIFAVVLVFAAVLIAIENRKKLLYIRFFAYDAYSRCNACV